MSTLLHDLEYQGFPGHDAAFGCTNEMFKREGARCFLLWYLDHVDDMGKAGKRVGAMDNWEGLFGHKSAGNARYLIRGRRFGI